MRLYGVNGRVMTSAGADGNWLTEDVSPYNFVSAIGNPYMFTARRWDHHTFLYYYRFRDYSPDLGRFLQTDPIGYIDGMNLYAYVNNNPLNWIDPWGLSKGCTSAGESLINIGTGLVFVGGMAICIGEPITTIGGLIGVGAGGICCITGALIDAFSGSPSNPPPPPPQPPLPPFMPPGGIPSVDHFWGTFPFRR